MGRCAHRKGLKATRMAALRGPGLHFLFWPQEEPTYTSCQPFLLAPWLPRPACSLSALQSPNSPDSSSTHMCQAPHYPAKAPSATWKSLFEANLWHRCVLGVGGWGDRESLGSVSSHIVKPPGMSRQPRGPGSSALGPTRSHPSPSLWPQGQPLHSHTSTTILRTALEKVKSKTS